MMILIATLMAMATMMLLIAEPLTVVIPFSLVAILGLSYLQFAEIFSRKGWQVQPFLI